VAWQPKLLEFDDVPLAEIVADFNRRNPLRLVIDDPALGAMRMTATFRSDNIEGFVRLIAGNYGVQVELLGNDVVLRRK
jgi:transmembrane sensor